MPRFNEMFGGLGNGLMSMDIRPMLPFHGEYSGITTLGDLLGRRQPGHEDVPEDPYLPWNYKGLFDRATEQGQPNQHFGLPKLNTFPELRPGLNIEDLWQMLPGDLSMDDSIPVESWPFDVQRQYGINEFNTPWSHDAPAGDWWELFPELLNMFNGGQQ